MLIILKIKKVYSQIGNYEVTIFIWFFVLNQSFHFPLNNQAKKLPIPKLL